MMRNGCTTLILAFSKTKVISAGKLDIHIFSSVIIYSTLQYNTTRQITKYIEHTAEQHYHSLGVMFCIDLTDVSSIFTHVLTLFWSPPCSTASIKKVNPSFFFFFLFFTENSCQQCLEMKVTMRQKTKQNSELKDAKTGTALSSDNWLYWSSLQVWVTLTHVHLSHCLYKKKILISASTINTILFQTL